MITGLHKDDPRVAAAKEAGVESVYGDEDLIRSIKQAC